MEDKPMRGILKSKTAWVNLAVALLAIGAKRGLELDITTEEIGAIFVALNIVMRLVSHGRVVLFGLLLFTMSSLGCARNTNSFNIGGTGFYVQTPVGMIAIGNFESHFVSSELANEQFEVTDTKFFQATGGMTVDDADGQTVEANTQRSFSMSVSPVEDPTWNDL